jgi:D-sedoheptulose 7-phosphate isomerase
MSRFDIGAYFAAEFDEHESVARASREALYDPFAQLATICRKAVAGGGKLLFFGNGGSAADAQHLATELTVRYRANRAPIAAIALTTDSSALTAIGNDLGFDELFARQVRALGRAGDVAIAITTSGRSPNIIRALEAARDMGITATALSGGDGGGLPGLADPLLLVPSKTTSRIQEMHITIGHMLCGALEQDLGLI